MSVGDDPDNFLYDEYDEEEGAPRRETPSSSVSKRRKVLGILFICCWGK